jgi:drug/metabolite transporter (DMT)-like permease
MITAMAIPTLGPYCFSRYGTDIFLSTTKEQWLLMLGAGVFNLLGFIALTTGLKHTTVVHGNVLNASQVAMAALAAMFFFHEPLTPGIIAGLVLTIVGIMLIDRPKTAAETVDTAV